MICSMTGYGAGESDLAGVRTVVELRSVNGRFCDIAVRLPKSLGSLEGRVRAYVQDHVTRGNVSVSVRCDDGDACDALRQLKDELGVSGEVSLEMVAAYPGLVTPEADEVDPAERWKGIETALERALVDFKDMKRNEGNALESDLRGRIQAIQALLRSVEDRAPDRVAEFRERHLEHLAELAEGPAPCGRKLDFLVQEMNREINTIGSKGNDTEISHSVIQAKEELEKVREQVQNIE